MKVWRLSLECYINLPKATMIKMTPKEQKVRARVCESLS
jgi:hypothetical protein